MLVNTVGVVSAGEQVDVMAIMSSCVACHAIEDRGSVLEVLHVPFQTGKSFFDGHSAALPLRLTHPAACVTIPLDAIRVENTGWNDG